MSAGDSVTEETRQAIDHHQIEDYRKTLSEVCDEPECAGACHTEAGEYILAAYDKQSGTIASITEEAEGYRKVVAWTEAVGERLGERPEITPLIQRIIDGRESWLQGVASDLKSAQKCNREYSEKIKELEARVTEVVSVPAKAVAAMIDFQAWETVDRLQRALWKAHECDCWCTEDCSGQPGLTDDACSDCRAVHERDSE